MVAVAIGVAAVAGVAGAAISADASSRASRRQAAAAGDAASAQVVAAEIAAETELEAQERNIAFQRELYQQQRADIAPFLEAQREDVGRRAEIAEQLQPGLRIGGEFQRPFQMEDFERDPGYQFRLQEGTRALDRSAAARGGLQGGRHQRDLVRFSQGLASDEYAAAFNRYQTDLTGRFNRLASRSGIPQTALPQSVQAGQVFGGRVGEAITRGGQARASGYLQAGQARAQGQIGAANAYAAGQIGQANAINQGLGGVSNALSAYMLYRGVQ